MATEETKPMEREAFERAIDELWPDVLFDWQLMDGEYVGETEQDYLKIWQASADAALERAAQLVETRGAARRDMYDLIGDEHAAEIRALKGSR